jgi:dGTPase
MKGVATPAASELAKRKYRDESQVGDVRTPFQHDKDRITHSTAFRRLQYKTQVYVIHEADLYRTRLTHSLEVAQIAGGIARQLQADVDLAEAIALAHDLGHAPFGHIGGDTLHDLLSEYGIPFDHNVQSYRIVTNLEERYTDFKGLNLTYATLEGILRHCTYFDSEEEIRSRIPMGLTEEVSQFWTTVQPSIEAQIVNIADSITYATHDIEDALEVGLLGWSEFQSMVEDHDIVFVIELINNDLKQAIDRYKNANPEASEEIIKKIQQRTLSRLLIDKLTRETITQTEKNLARLNSKNGKLWEEVRVSESAVVALKPNLEKQLRILLDGILFSHVYREPRVMVMMQKGKRILETLFSACMEEPKIMPARTQAKLMKYYQMSKKKQSSKLGKSILARVVADYISGMTDKYAMDTYQLLTQAYEKAL